jgi:hypothetical protein
VRRQRSIKLPLRESDPLVRPTDLVRYDGAVYYVTEAGADFKANEQELTLVEV